MSEGSRKVNVPLLIASFIASFMLWAAVYAQSLPVSTRQFEVDLLRDGFDSQRLAILRGDMKLKVWVTGTEQQINELRDAEKYGQIDLSGAASGEHSYPVYLQPPLLRELAHDRVPEVRMRIEPVLRRKLRVTPTSVGRLSNAPQHNLDQLITDPATVTVSGPDSVIKQVAEARVVYDLALADPNRSAPHNLPVEAVDAKGRRIENVEISPIFVAVTPILVPSPVQRTASVLVRFKGAPLMGFEMAGYRVEPANVTLEGASFATNTVSSVETMPVDITNLAESKSLEATLKLPAGVTAVKPNRVTVRVILRKAPSNPKPDKPVVDQIP